MSKDFFIGREQGLVDLKLPKKIQALKISKGLTSLLILIYGNEVQEI